MIHAILSVSILLFGGIKGPKNSPPNAPIILTVQATSASLVYPSYIPLTIVNQQVIFTPTLPDTYVFFSVDNATNSYQVFPVVVSAAPITNEQIYSFVIFDQRSPIVFDDPTIFDVLKQQNIELRVWPKTNPLIPVLKLDRYATSLPTIITYTKSGKFFPQPAIFPRNSADLINYFKALKTQ